MTVKRVVAGAILVPLAAGSLALLVTSNASASTLPTGATARSAVALNTDDKTTAVPNATLAKVTAKIAEALAAEAAQAVQAAVQAAAAAAQDAVGKAANAAALTSASGSASEVVPNSVVGDGGPVINSEGVVGCEDLIVGAACRAPGPESNSDAQFNALN